MCVWDVILYKLHTHIRNAWIVQISNKIKWCNQNEIKLKWENMKEDNQRQDKTRQDKIGKQDSYLNINKYLQSIFWHKIHSHYVIVIPHIWKFYWTLVALLNIKFYYQPNLRSTNYLLRLRSFLYVIMCAHTNKQNKNEWKKMPLLCSNLYYIWTLYARVCVCVCGCVLRVQRLRIVTSVYVCCALFSFALFV